jgi:hypothetical protein
MFVVVQHTITDAPSALQRGERLQRGEGAPQGTRVLQFLPSTDGRLVTCLWESDSVADVQSYADGTLGDASINVCYEVDASVAFAQRPADLPERPVFLAA